MRFVTYLDDQERIGVVHGDAVHDVTALLDRVHRPGQSRMKSLIDHYEELRDGLAAAADPTPRALDAVQLLPPVPDPTKVVAAPVNYIDHMHEMSATYHISSLGVFLKAPSSLLEPNGVVRLPYTDRRFDQEGELAFIVGRTARHVSVDDALDHIFGYTCLLDITMRGGEDRSTRKSFDTFTPCGPIVVTADEIGDPSRLGLQCAVNGEPRQDAPIKDLVWDIPALLAYVSSVMTLHPGDVVTTGTPAGVGSLRHGDEITLTITDIGTLRVRVSADGAASCPTQGATRGPVPPAERPR